MVALNWLICCCNELICLSSALSALAVCCLNPLGTKPEECCCKGVGPSHGFGLRGPGDIEHEHVVALNGAGRLAQQRRRTEGGLAQQVGRTLPDRRGLQERQVVCHASRRIGPRSLGEVESGVCAVTPGHDQVVTESDHKAQSGEAQPDLATTAKALQDEAKTDEPTNEHDRGLGLRRRGWTEQRCLSARS